MEEEKSEASPRLERGLAGELHPVGNMARVVIGAIVIAGLYFARPVLEPIALAVLLSLLLAPAVRWLHLCGVGRNSAVLAAVLLAFIVIIGFGAAVGEQVVGLVRNLPQYEDNIGAKIRSLNGVPGAGVLERATRVFHDLSSELEGSTTSRAPSPTVRAPGGRSIA